MTNLKDKIKNTLLNYLGFGEKKINVYELAMQKLEENPCNITEDSVYQKLEEIRNYYDGKPLDNSGMDLLLKTYRIVAMFQDEMRYNQMNKETYENLYELPVKNIIKLIKNKKK